MNWHVGWRPPPKEYREIPGLPSGTWEPVLRLGGGKQFRKLESDSFLSSKDGGMWADSLSGIVQYSRRPGLSRGRFSPDGEKILATDVEGGLSVYDVLTGTRIYWSPNAHDLGINDGCWHGTSNSCLLTASSDRKVKVFCISVPPSNKKKKAGEISFEEAHGEGALCVASERYHFGGGMIAYSGGCDEMVKAWDLRNPVEPVIETRAHQGPVCSIELSHDDRVCASTSFDGYVRLWDTRSFQILRTLIAKQMRPCHHAVFSPNDLYLLCKSIDGDLRNWNLYPEGRSKYIMSNNKEVDVKSITERDQNIDHCEELMDRVDAMAYWSFDHEYINMVPCEYDVEEDKKNPEVKLLAAKRSRQEAIHYTERLMLKRLSIKTERLLKGTSLRKPQVGCKSWLQAGNDKKQPKSNNETNHNENYNHGIETNEDENENTQKTDGQKGNNIIVSGQERFPCGYVSFWRDRVIAGANDGCIHIWDGYTGVHEHRLGKWHNIDSAISSVDAHPNKEVGVIASTGTEPDSSLIMWTYVPNEDKDLLGLSDLSI